MQSRQAHFGFLVLHRETKFIIGFDFAVTLSSPASSCVLFDITSRQSVRTEMADVEQTQEMIPFITCEISLCQYVCELVLGVDALDLDFGFQINSIIQPIKSNSVGSRDVSHSRASSIMIILITALLSSNTYNKAS